METTERVSPAGSPPPKPVDSKYENWLSQDVFIERDGKQRRGFYRIISEKDPMIEVCTGSGRKSAVLHRSPPEVLARILLNTLIDEKERMKCLLQKPVEHLPGFIRDATLF